ncbi:hypothetical protein N7478_000647 [Penicillium angulare]|uniref:uncharacterized protein n=1 Tax=Penicillium angulare TaxID=116970 RepID=UPI0025410E0C|nr:uncharacterized protein N7478_000647 [Penicillium angulare]KAJ5291396.1 hypothetical protein N7478_000647 [Penicillium angulare]
MGTRFTNDTKDPAINVTAWCLLVVMILSVSTRLGTKYRLFHKLDIDDLLIVAALFLAVGQTLVVSLAVGSGYGSHFEEISSPDAVRVMKSLYAAFLLYIMSLFLSKMSFVIFIRQFTPVAKGKRLSRGIEITLYVWALTALLGSAFQCKSPPWDLWHGQCFNLLAWRYFVVISNIATETLLLSQLIPLVLTLRIVKHRLIVGSIFMPRLFVITASICEIPFLKKATQTTDPAYDLCNITIFEMVIQCLGIVAACWPQLQPFLSWVQSSGLVMLHASGTQAQDYKTRSSTKSSGGRVESHELSDFRIRSHSTEIAEGKTEGQLGCSSVGMQDHSADLESLDAGSQQSWQSSILVDQTHHRCDHIWV